MAKARSKTVEKQWELVDPIVQGHLEAYYRLLREHQVSEEDSTSPTIENIGAACRAAIEAGMVEGEWSADEVATWPFKVVHERWDMIQVALKDCLTLDPN
jgi:hypothetical protein